MAVIFHLGDCMQACVKCTDIYHSQFNNAPCDTCYEIVESGE